MEQRPGYVGPLLILAIGFILLFNNLGLFPWEIWGRLFRYWPVILILLGIQVFARNSGSRLMYFAAIFLSILLIIGTVFLAWNGYPRSTGTDLRKAILDNAGYNFADLDNADFSNSSLNGTDMNFATMQNANFSNSSLNGANMNFADLEYAKFNNAGLKGANLNFANLKYADLSDAVLDGANMNFVNLEGANMTGARVEGVNHGFARTSRSTICPDSRNGPCW